VRKLWCFRSVTDQSQSYIQLCDGQQNHCRLNFS